jgi:hypothetical protein
LKKTIFEKNRMEKIAEKRNSCLRPINILCEENYQTEMALNISESGIYITGDEMPPVGTKLALVFRNSQNRTTSQPGKVVWKDTNGMGIRFE